MVGIDKDKSVNEKKELMFLFKFLLDNHKISEQEYRKALDKLSTYK